ncbi:MAG TPA: L,D-transpeptidase family protein [Myxococcota bacterium]|jgi:hypothetical protein|nr:L,D-transpeptidase family protein [Myxococcota bacterium]
MRAAAKAKAVLALGLAFATAVVAVAFAAPERRAAAFLPVVVPAPPAPALEGTVFAARDGLAARMKKVRARLGAAAPALGARTIRVDKSERRMDLRLGDVLLRSYVVNLGFDPLNDKQREGDGCTPEGSFYVCTRGPSKAFHRFLGLSYPNAEDAARGLRDGLIGRSAFDDIRAALTRHERPSWATPLGGAIGIHGRGVRAAAPGGGVAVVDWTAGCIAVTDEEIQEIYEQFVTSTGVPVEVVP